MKWAGLIALVLGFSSQAYGTYGLVFYGYTTNANQTFFGLSFPGLQGLEVPVKAMAPVHQQKLKLCMEPQSVHTYFVARVVIDAEGKFNSDVRSLNLMTNHPRGFRGPIAKVIALDCVKQSPGFRSLWLSELKKLR